MSTEAKVLEYGSRSTRVRSFRTPSFVQYLLVKIGHGIFAPILTVVSIYRDRGRTVLYKVIFGIFRTSYFTTEVRKMSGIPKKTPFYLPLNLFPDFLYYSKYFY